MRIGCLFLLMFLIAVLSSSIVFGLTVENNAVIECIFQTNDVELSAMIGPSLELDAINPVWISYTINNFTTIEIVNDYVDVGDNRAYSYILDSSELIAGMDVEWNYYANDTNGTEYNGILQIFSVKEGIIIENKTNPFCVLETENISLSADIAPSLEIADVWISYTINNVNYNNSVEDFVNDTYTFILNSSELISGQNVTWNYYARDTCGNLYNNSWQEFYVKRGIIIENKTNSNNCAFEDQNVTLSADIGPLFDISSVLLNYTTDGVNYNSIVVSSVDENYSYILDLSGLPGVGGQNVIWNYYANDVCGNEYNNSWQEFYVRNRTKLNVNPTVPDGLDDWYITEPIFTLIKDLFGGDTNYRWDSIDDINYTGPFMLEDIPGGNNTAGILELTYWGEFDSCEEEEQEQVFKVDLTDPIITELNPTGVVLNNLVPEISAYIDEVYLGNSGINYTLIVMELDDIIVNATVGKVNSIGAIVRYVPDFNLSEGNHNVSLYVEDNAGRVSEVSWNFTILLSPVFDIDVISPENKTYDTRRVLINITLTGTVDLLEYKDNMDNNPRWLRLCKDCDGYDRFKNFKDGQHEIIIRATDQLGFTNEQTVSFEVDSKEPKISWILPKNKATVNGTGFGVRYTEENLKSVDLTISNGSDTLVYGVDDCESGKNKECYIDVDLSAYDGQLLNYWFNVSDYVNSVESRTYSVNVDTTDPVITLNSPIETLYSTRNVLFDLEVSEIVKSIEYRDNLGRWRGVCNRCDSYNNTKHFISGNHTVDLIAIDYAGNSDSSTIEFTVT